MKCSLSLSSNSLLHRKRQQEATERDEKEPQKVKETERGHRNRQAEQAPHEETLLKQQHPIS
jgi:hypothetical protein